MPAWHHWFLDRVQATVKQVFRSKCSKTREPCRGRETVNSSDESGLGPMVPLIDDAQWFASRAGEGFLPPQAAGNDIKRCRWHGIRGCYLSWPRSRLASSANEGVSGSSNAFVRAALESFVLFNRRFATPIK